MMLCALLASAACRQGIEEAPGLVPDEQPDTLNEDVAVRFVDMTAQARISFVHAGDVRTSVLTEDTGSGTAWGDYDRDGMLDLFIVNSSKSDRGRLYRNRGDGTFEDVTEPSEIRQTGLGMGAVWFDHDGDGNIDLFTTGFGWQMLYRNRGDGVFEDVTGASGLEIKGGWPAGPAVADYDLDGDLDIYVPHYVDFHYGTVEEGSKLSKQYGLDTPFTLNPASYEPLANALYRNNGDGTFTDVSAAAGVADAEGRSLQAVFSDLNMDGHPDIYVGNDISPDALFISQGDGTFENVAIYARTADARGSMGIAVGDYDGDLDPDLWVTHWIAQDDALFRNMSEKYTGREIRFIDQIAPAVGEHSLTYVGWGVGFFDYDNDGGLDIFVVNGSTFELPEDRTRLEPQRNLLFHNRRDSTFTLANQSAGDVWNAKNVGRGASFADYDNDGDLDILILARGEGVRLLQNQGGNKKGWLTIDLHGAAGNGQAVGAAVTVSVDSVKQRKVVTVGSSYLSMSDTRLHFGLGDSKSADWVEIRWPDGELQRLNDVGANRILSVIQGE
jgi:hypothetical protein